MPRVRSREPAPVPALERGLKILGVVSRSPGPVAFSRLAGEVGVSASSLSRILRVLLDNGYLRRDAVGRGYLPGPMLAAAGNASAAPIDRLRAAAAELLPGLVETARCTAIALHCDRGRMVCVAKVTEPEGLAMQEVGTISSNLGGAPWGWLLYFSLGPSERRAALATMTDAARFRREIAPREDEIRAAGYAFDNGWYDPLIRRIAAPVWSAGTCVAAVGAGTLSARTTEPQARELGRRLAEVATEIGRRLR